MATVHHRECLFCKANLYPTQEIPVNLAFMEHIEVQEACAQDFEQWTRNMHRDFKGD